MSYGAASALHDVILETLRSSDEVTARVGSDIFDSVPPGTLPALYIATGPETVRDASDFLEQAAEHDFVISVIGNGASFQAVKDTARAVNDVVLQSTLTLTRGTLVALRFLKAEARRDRDAALRQIDLTFRARIDAIDNS